MTTQKDILAVAGISRQSYHQHFGREQHAMSRSEDLLHTVATARKTRAYHKMGARPLYHALDINVVGINKFEQILSAGGMNVFVKKNFRKTTNGLRWKEDVNLVKNTHICDINRVILGDITYLPVGNGFYYIYTLKDAYSKRILGLYGSKDLEASSAVRCLKQAVRLRGSQALKGCIHHSDAGVQYKSKLYRKTAKYLKWSIAANCLENGMAEQLNFILKEHYLGSENIKNTRQLNVLLKEVKRMMNERRPVRQLGYKTPVEFEEMIRGMSIEKRRPFKFKDPEKRGLKGDFEGGISIEES